jgi:hypothetical protein
MRARPLWLLIVEDKGKLQDGTWQINKDRRDASRCAEFGWPCLPRTYARAEATRASTGTAKTPLRSSPEAVIYIG